MSYFKRGGLGIPSFSLIFFGLLFLAVSFSAKVHIKSVLSLSLRRRQLAQLGLSSCLGVVTSSGRDLLDFYVTCCSKSKIIKVDGRFPNQGFKEGSRLQACHDGVQGDSGAKVFDLDCLLVEPV